MQKLAWGDRVTLTLAGRPGVRCRCADPAVPQDRTNLAVRAAEAVLRAVGRERDIGVEINLEKRIPVAAGLGGGSSDAGLVLRGLNDLLEQPVDERRLLELARSLGADVPFFVFSGVAALATGIGERLAPVAGLGGYRVLLVNPGFAVSTRWVFENYALTMGSKKSTFRGSRYDEEGPFTPELLHNDLEQVTAEHYPIIIRIKQALMHAGADGALMAGSGPTVFGLFARTMFPDDEVRAIGTRITEESGGRFFLTRMNAGASPSGKAPGFDPGIS